MRLNDRVNIPDRPYPELRQVLNAFVAEVSAVLGENLVGIYLVGSIATGDFDLDSDVDFMVVTRTELVDENVSALQQVQKRIFDLGCYPAQHLEGSYISVGDLNDRTIVGKKNLYYFDNGSTVVEQTLHDNQWHVRWVLREHGIALVGPDPKTILRAIPLGDMIAEIKAAMRQTREIFRGEIDRQLGFCNSRFGQSFFVLTYCRMLHTLHTGTVQSKKAGVVWARQFLHRKWIDLIDQAWAERDGVRFGVKIRQRAEPALLQETLDFIDYAISQSDRIEQHAS